MCRRSDTRLAAKVIHEIRAGAANSRILAIY
jgi:hypothetical protein